MSNAENVVFLARKNKKPIKCVFLKFYKENLLQNLCLSTEKVKFPHRYVNKILFVILLKHIR